MVKAEIEKWMRLIRLCLESDPPVAVDSLEYNSDCWRAMVTVFKYVYDAPELMNGPESEA